jgi:MFS family permease
MALTTILEATELEAIRTDTGTTRQEGSPREHAGDTLAEPGATHLKTSKLRMVATVVQLASLNLLSSFTNGVITVGLTTIARDIDLPRELYLWPLSVYGLTCGSMLLMAGSITDVVGPRRVELVAAFLLGVFVLVCGVADTGLQLTLFRAFQGVAMAMHLPAAVSIVAGTIPKGKARNMSFAALGFARDIGYSVGLVLSGFLIDTRGWRLNFYLAGGAVLVLVAVAAWSLPEEKSGTETTKNLLRQLLEKVDWAGAIIISTGLALLAYVLA